MPEFTAINKSPKSELNLYHAFNITQHLAGGSISRWNQETLNKLLGGDPHSGKPVQTHIGGGSRCDSWERKEIADWWRRTMIELINRKLEDENKDTMNPDAYPYLAAENSDRT